MGNHYPSQQDIATPDKLERVLRDIYDRIYALERLVNELLKKVSKT
jgi:hypothetical protein